MFGHNESPEPVPPRPPLIARVYGTLLILLGLGATLMMARTLSRPVQQGAGMGLYLLPAAAIALTPGFILVHLGIKIMRGERMAVYALAIVLLIVGVVIMALDVRRGGLVIGATLVALAPLCRAAIRESGGFH